MIFSIILFFILAIGFGFLVDLLLKEWQASMLEKFVIRIGVGLGAIPILGVLLNVLRIPLDWKIFLLFALVISVSAIYLNRRRFKKELFEGVNKINSSRITKKQFYSFLVFVMFVITAYMYLSGAFNNTYYADSDPWQYALHAKHIAVTKSYSADFYFDHFSEPYPQGMGILMGILHQTNDSLFWNMKFFHAFIISLSILFFYFLIKRFSKNDEIAFFSTLAIFAVPAWFSHFIFSLSFNMTLMLVFFYTLILIKDNKKWKYLSIVLFASIWVTHFYTAFVMTMFFLIYYLNKVFVEEDFNKEILQVGFFGFLLSLFYWVPAIYKFSSEMNKTYMNVGGMEMFYPAIEKIVTSSLYVITFLGLLILLSSLYYFHKRWFVYIQKILRIPRIKQKIFFVLMIIILSILIFPSEKLMYAKGSGTRTYGFNDFFIAQHQNLINNPTGIGLAIMTLFIMGILLIIFNIRKLFDKKNFFLSTSFLWSIFGFLGVMGASLSIGFVPFRMWTFFSLGVAMVTGFMISNILKVFKDKKIKVALVILIGILIFFTSFQQKYTVNTVMWPEHKIMSPSARDIYF